MAETKSADDKVARVVAGFTSSWNYTSGSYHAKWQQMNDLYSSRRVQVGYNGISDTFVPMSFSTVETLVSATSGDKPRVEYIATSPEEQTNTDVLNGLFSYYWDLDNWTNKKVMSTRQYFKIGTTVEYYYWDIDHPVMQLIPVRDFFCDPTATILGYQNAGYMGHRFLANKDDLEKEQIVDIDEKSKTYGQLVPKYKNLKNLDTSYEIGDPTDKQEKDTHMGSTLDKTAQSGQIEVICYWTKDEVLYVGNRQEVIYEAKNYFKERQEFLGWENPTGMYPYIVDSNLPDESQLYGTSVLQSIAKPQELLNDLTNQNVDAVSWSLDPVMELDPMYSSYIDKIKNVTGAVYPFKPGSYSAVNKPMIPSNAFNERTNIKNEIRETTAVDEIMKGVQTQSRTTATEIKAQVALSGRRFDTIISQLENGGYYQMAKLIFQMVRLYVTTPTMYRIIGKNGVDWKTFDPEMFQGEYEPRIKLKATLDQEKTSKMRNLKELYTSMLGNPMVDQAAMTRLIIEKAFDLEPDEVDALMADPEKMAETGPAEEEGSPKELINYKDAPDDIQAQMEAAAGYEPSVVHEGAMETAAAKQMAEQALAGEQITPTPTTAAMPMIPGAPQGSPPRPREGALL